MAERPGTPNGRSRVSILAERFGMTNEEVEELLRSTREEYSAPGSSAPEAIPSPVPQPVTVAAISGPNRQPVSGIFLIVLFTGLLIALGVALSLKHGWFQQRPDRLSAMKQADTMEHSHKQFVMRDSTPTGKSPDTVSDEVPPDMLAAAHEKHPAATAPTPRPAPAPRSALHKKKSNTRSLHTVTKPALTTSSEFDAEEQLADLRADGNTKAHIKTTRKGGSLKYQVFEK